MRKIDSDTFRRIYEHSSDIISVHNMDGTLLEISPACEELLGYSQEELIGSSSYPLFHEEDRQQIFKTYLAIAEPPHIHKVDYRIRHKDGRYLWFESTSSLMKEDGRSLIVSFTRDITDHKRTEQKLELELESRKQLFSVVSHEMRNSFQALLIYGLLLTEDLDHLEKDQIREYANEIYISTVDVTELLNNMVDWSKLHRDDLPFEPEKIDLKPIVDKIVRLYHNQSAKKGVTFDVRMDDSARAYADPVMCESIIRNLISNAIKFSNQDGEITIDAAPAPEENRTVVTVTDRGIGMSPEKADRLFEGSTMFDPMERLSDDTGIGRSSGSVMGTGIGLSLCRDFVRKHGGEIRAESEPGEGTSISFELPLEPEEKP